MPKKVLLVEDDEDNRDLIYFVLKRSQLDISLIVAENGKQAIDLTLQHMPDLILMDMQMPVMDGWTAVSILKRNDITRLIPIFACTAQTKSEDRVKALQIGCAEHIPKPIVPDELIAQIKKYLNL